MFEVGDIIADTDAGMLAMVVNVAPATETYALEYKNGNVCIVNFDDPYLTSPCPVCNGAEISSAQVFGSDIVVRVCEKCGEEWT